MESGSRAQVLFFVIHVYFDASDDIKFDNLLLCIYVVCTIIITYFWIWRTLILKRKFDKIVAVAQELERGYKGGGGAVLPGTPPHVSVDSGPWVVGTPFPQWHFSPSRCLYKTNRAIVFMSIFMQKHHTNNHLVRIWSVWRLI